MVEYSKKMRKELHRLAGLAYERELSDELSKLAKEFERWQAKAINEFDLTDAIHQFHDHAARDLYKMYSYGRDQIFLVGLTF